MHHQALQWFRRASHASQACWKCQPNELGFLYTYCVSLSVLDLNESNYLAATECFIPTCAMSLYYVTLYTTHIPVLSDMILAISVNTDKTRSVQVFVQTFGTLFLATMIFYFLSFHCTDSNTKCIIWTACVYRDVCIYCTCLLHTSKAKFIIYHVYLWLFGCCDFSFSPWLWRKKFHLNAFLM